MSSKLLPRTRLPFHIHAKPQRPNTKSVLLNFPPHRSFNTHFTKSRVFVTSPGSYRSRTKAAVNDHPYTITQNAESFYDLLGIGKNESLTEIKRAYKQLARKYHPDASPPGLAEEYTTRFIRLHEAYETLSDPLARALYDRDMSLPLECDKRWGDWKTQLQELEWWTANKISRGIFMSWGARIRNRSQGQS